MLSSQQHDMPRQLFCWSDDGTSERTFLICRIPTRYQRTGCGQSQPSISSTGSLAASDDRHASCAVDVFSWAPRDAALGQAGAQGLGKLPRGRKRRERPRVPRAAPCGTGQALCPSPPISPGHQTPSPSSAKERTAGAALKPQNSNLAACVFVSQRASFKSLACTRATWQIAAR